VVGVVSTGAPAYALSLERGEPVSHAVDTLLADGMACRTPEPEAVALIRREVDDIVAVTDDEIAAAMRALFADTHNLAEGAGAASLAAALQQCERCADRSVGLVITGANVDSAVFARVLAGA
jgi:threonine dehydratase